MSKMKDTIDEDRILLLAEERPKKFHNFYQPHYEIASVKGASNLLEKWPAYLLLVFLAAAIIVTIVCFFVLITAFTIPVIVHYEHRGRHEFSNETWRNVYFVKMKSRQWTSKEFCYIESAARENPLLNIHLVSLRRNRTEDGIEKDNPSISLIGLIMEGIKTSHEKYFENLLIPEYRNIEIMDVSVGNFFKGTSLAKFAENLSDETLVTAAQTFLVWNSSGIALSPDKYCNIKYVSQFLCRNVNGRCNVDELATIDPINNIEAAAIPCQVFMGFLLQEITKDHLARRKFTLKSSLNEFCPSVEQCAEVRILKQTRSCHNVALNCSTIERLKFH